MVNRYRFVGAIRNLDNSWDFIMQDVDSPDVPYVEFNCQGWVDHIDVDRSNLISAVIDAYNRLPIHEIPSWTVAHEDVFLKYIHGGKNVETA